MINLKKSPEIFSQNQEKIENKEVQSNFEELKKSKEKGFFDKAGEKISHYYDVAEKSIKKDVKEKKWGKLLLKGGATLLGLWGVKKATELVSSATKNIFSIFGFGKEKLDESVSNTTWEMLKGPLKFIVGGAVVNQLFKFINGESPLDQLGDFVQKNLGDVPDALKKMLYQLPVVGGLIKSSFEKSDDDGVEIKRTDRHNNPAAIIYEGFSKNLKVLGYVEGEDFEKGDEFTDEEGKKYHTIKFKDKKTGIEATIKLIDKVGFFNESLGKNRWD
ncbi:hypothetical protein LR002_02290, partial [Candidatus Gracilibacteria bacterium]|nr:hypothetical protein [Candidatus Gracilibacteria bacterium]